MRQFLIVVGLLLLLTVIGTVGIHTLTEMSWLESAYTAVVTLTTVGSRDVPNEPDVIIFTILFLIGGLGVFTYSAFQLGDIVVNTNIRRFLEQRRMDHELEQLKDHFIVCGLGRMGIAICESLERRGLPFVAIDRSQNRGEEVCLPRRWIFIEGDATDDDVLKSAGMESARGLCSVLGTDADNLYVVLSARLLSAELQIIARASDQSAIQKLKRAGATRVVSPFTSGAEKMTRIMLSPHLEDFLEIQDGAGRDLEIAELEICSGSPYLHKRLSETDFSTRGIVVVGGRRPDGQNVLVPPATLELMLGDKLFAFGNADAVNEMVQDAQQE